MSLLHAHWNNAQNSVSEHTKLNSLCADNECRLNVQVESARESTGHNEILSVYCHVEHSQMALSVSTKNSLAISKKVSDS
jgi:hypothetical protein